MNTAERITNIMNGEWFKVLVSQKYDFDREVQQATEEEIREAGFDQQIVLTAFRFKNLEPDFMREVVESTKGIKTQLERELILDIQQYSVHSSTFYQNMYIYLKLNLAEQRELKNYSEQVGQMYMNQLQQEYQSREIASWVDYNGKVQEIIVI